MRYPAEPLQPSYYAQLLATAVSMTEEEQRARALMEPRETPRGKSDGREVGAPEVSIGIEGDWLGDAQQPHSDAPDRLFSNRIPCNWQQLQVQVWPP